MHKGRIPLSVKKFHPPAVVAAKRSDESEIQRRGSALKLNISYRKRWKICERRAINSPGRDQDFHATCFSYTRQLLREREKFLQEEKKNFSKHYFVDGDDLEGAREKKIRAQ